MRSLLHRLSGISKFLGKREMAPPLESPADERPMQRWDDKKLAAVDAQLKAKPAEAWTPEDHYLSIELVVQRYMPRTEAFSESQWREAKLKFKFKVDAALEELRNGGDLGMTERHRRQTERERLGQLFREPLLLDEQQFREVILPALARFAFAPAPEALSDEDVRLLARACMTPYGEGVSYQDRYAILECQDHLRARFHPAVVETGSALRSHYELLLRAKRSGYREVKIGIRPGCSCMSAALDGKRAPVEGLIRAFENGDPSYPLLPVPATSCSSAEDPRLCGIFLMALEPVDTQDPDYDAEFQTTLDQILSGDRQDISVNWASQLNRSLF